MIELVVVDQLHQMSLFIIILTIFFPSLLLCCENNKTYEIVEYYTTTEFHGISDLGIAVINNEIDKIANLIGDYRNALIYFNLHIDTLPRSGMFCES